MDNWVNSYTMPLKVDAAYDSQTETKNDKALDLEFLNVKILGFYLKLNFNML